jgi:YD repeat-containing protein
VSLYSTATVSTYRGGKRITDNAGNTIIITCDMLGRMVSCLDPDRGAWSYSYDNKGNVISQTDARARATLLQYDVLDRVKRMDFPNDTSTIYSYDELAHGASIGRLTSVSYNRGSESYSYDPKGRTSSVARALDGRQRTMAYQYDSLDRLSSLQFPGPGETVTSAYGSDGNVVSVSGTSTYANSILYTPFNSVASMAYGNGVTTSYDYYDTDEKQDPYNGNRHHSYRLRRLRVGASAGVMNLEYQYDGAGNIRKRIDGNTSSWTETYAYDDLDRLVTAAASASGYGSLSFAYDQIDNITSKDGKSYTYGTAHPHAVASAGTDTYGYNANGDMTGWKGRTIGYDDAGRMISLSGPNGETYSYDGSSQRRIKTQGTKTTYYFFRSTRKSIRTGPFPIR